MIDIPVSLYNKRQQSIDAKKLQVLVIIDTEDPQFISNTLSFKKAFKDLEAHLKLNRVGEIILNETLLQLNSASSQFKPVPLIN